MGIEDFAPIGTIPGIQPINQPEPDVFAATPNLNNKLTNEPSNISGREILGKIGIGIGVGGVITAVLFMITTFVGGMFSSAMTWAGTAGSSSNPILSIILLFIGFISTFIGNLAIGGIYNLFFSRKYINGSKVYGLLLLTNGLLFFIFAPIYLIFSSQVQILFIVLGFHIVFSIFISACQTEFSANPNYSGSALIGNTIGFAFAIVVYCVMYKQSLLNGAEKQTYLLMLLPTILGYSLIPFGASIREKIYYKSYEMGNNGFYLSSVDEREEVSPEETAKEEENEINIEG